MPNDYDSFDDLLQDSYVSRSEVKKLARDEFQKILSDVNTFASQAQAGVSNAIREVTAAHPDFEERRPQMLAVLQEIPLLRDAVASAEGNPSLSSTLPQIYETVYRASQAPSRNNEPSKPALDAGRASDLSDLSDENAQYQAALASQRINLSPENRKSLIASLEKSGVLDIEF